MGLRRQEGGLSQVFSFSSLLFLGILAACGQPGPRLSQDPKNTPNSTEASCNSLLIQDAEWGHQNTVALSQCVLGDNFQAANLSPEELSGLTQYLRESFKTEDSRAQLSSLINNLKAHYPLLKKWAKLPSFSQLLEDPQLVPSLPWFHQNLRLFLHPRSSSPLSASEKQQLVLGLRSLSSAQNSLPVIESLVSLLDQVNQGENSQIQLEASYRVLRSASETPQVFDYLLALSEEHSCSRNEIGSTPAKTQAPLWTALNYFQVDKESPLYFLSSIKQGFEFWHQVCRSRTGLQPNALDPTLSWVFSNWSDLQTLIAGKENSFAQEAVELIHHDKNLSQSLIQLLFNKRAGETAVSQIVLNARLRSQWIEGARAWLEQKRSNDKRQSLSEFKFLHEALQVSDSSGTSAHRLGEFVASLPVELLQSLATILQKPRETIQTSVEALLKDDLLLKRLELLEWLIRTKETEAPRTWQARPAAREIPPSPVGTSSSAAHALLKKCSKPNGTLNYSCYQQAGVKFMPEWTFPLLELQANSRFLEAARTGDFENLARRGVARPFWKPAFTLIRDQGLPLRPILRVMDELHLASQRHPSRSWNPLLHSVVDQLQFELTRESSDTYKKLVSLRRQKLTVLQKSKQFSNESLRFLSSTSFLERLMSVGLSNSSRSRQLSREALVRIAKIKKPLSFWLGANKRTALNVDPFEALDLMLWELDFAGLSSASLGRMVLNSWLEVRSVSQARSWFSSREAALKLLMIGAIGNKNGEGLRGRLQNVLAILDYYKTLKPNEIQSLLSASKLLGVFGPVSSQARVSTEGVRGLFLLHKMGIVPSVSVALRDGGLWSKDFVRGYRIPHELRKHFAKQVSSLLKSASLKSMREWSIVQLNTNSKPSTLALMPLFRGLFHAPKLSQKLLNDAEGTSQLTAAALSLAKAWAPSAPQSFSQDLLLLEKVLKELPVPANLELLELASLAEKERALDPLIESIETLSDPQIDSLISWLQTGLAERLFQWNRLVRPER